MIIAIIILYILEYIGDLVFIPIFLGAMAVVGIISFIRWLVCR